MTDKRRNEPMGNMLSKEELVSALGTNLENWTWETENEKYVVNKEEGLALAEFIREHLHGNKIQRKTKTTF
jgi:hypothetical protein